MIPAHQQTVAQRDDHTTSDQHNQSSTRSLLATQSRKARLGKTDTQNPRWWRLDTGSTTRTACFESSRCMCSVCAQVFTCRYTKQTASPSESTTAGFPSTLAEHNTNTYALDTARIHFAEMITHTCTLARTQILLIFKVDYLLVLI